MSRIQKILDKFRFGSKQLKQLEPGVWVDPETFENQEALTQKEGLMINSPFQAQKQEQGKFKAEFDWLDEPSKGVRWDFNPMMTRNLSQDDTWVQMCVQSITKEVANTPWQIVTNEDAEVAKSENLDPFDRMSKDISKDPADSQEAREARDLIRDPNPDQDASDLFQEMMADLLEVGSLAAPKVFPERAYNEDNVLVEDTAKPVHIQVLAPETFTKDYQGKTGVLDGFWQYDKNRAISHQNTSSQRSGPIQFAQNELIWSDFNSRSNRRYGIPPTLIVQDWLMLLDLTTEQEKRYWSRGAFAAGFIKSNGDIDEIQALKGEMNEGRGKPEKQVMHIEDPDAEWVQMGLNWDQLNMNEREEWYAKIIASAFQVPTSIIGMNPENVNRATFEAERENFESNSLGPYLQKLERVINNQLIWQHFSKEIRFEFKPGMSETQRASISERVTSEFSQEVITRNEARQQLGYDEAEEDGFQSELTEEDEEDPEDLLNLNINAEKESKELSAQDFLYDSESDAELVAELMGLNGAHEHDDGWMPGESHEDFMQVFDSVKDEVSDCIREKLDEGWSHDRAVAACLNMHESSCKEELSEDAPLRETEEWHQFQFQPSEVEEFKELIQEDIKQVWNKLSQDERINEIIEAFAKDETEKNSAELRRRLNQIIRDAAVSSNIADKVLDFTTSKVEQVLERVEEEEDEKIDKDPVVERLQNRDMSFADNYAERFEEDIRDVVSEGWQEDKSIDQIRDDLQEKADEFTDFQAERIARDQMQRATGQARNEFARQTDRVEVWLSSGDGRVRPAHQEMDGSWKRPNENWEVPYERAAGTVEEQFPGDSRHGIQCRCDTLLRDIEDVDEANHAGTT